MTKRRFYAEMRHVRNNEYPLWTHENHAIEPGNNKMIDQRIDYIHMNPVRSGIVVNPEDYISISARNYWSYNNVPIPALTRRSFTGHEYLDAFALINMNGKVYDPVLGRFLSPDNYVRILKE